MYNLF